jgi:1-acyl-sn-glycerol-3-phosphate acyltransferase
VGRPSRRPPPGFRFVAAIVILLVNSMRWRVTTEGLEHVPLEGGAVITWNHTSHVDFLVTMWDVYRRLGRDVRYLALRELWDSKAFGWVPRLANAVPVDRASAGGRSHALRDAIAALQDGDLVMVAPEGTISESFELLPFRAGAARMAQLAGVPVIPSVSWGSHRLVTTGHPIRFRRAWRIPVTVRFGEPIHIAADADPIEVTERIRAATETLLHEVQAAYPDGAPAGAWWVPARLGGGAPPHDETVLRRTLRRANGGRDRDDRAAG